MGIIEKARQAINKNRLFNYGDKVLIAVSGGPDSVALLHILHKTRHEWGLALSVAHVNHHLRKDSQKDQKFVEELCENLRLPFFPISIRDIKSIPGSLEENARIRRYEELIGLSKNQKISSLAVAHTQDDLAETVLMRILRGTGLLGLKGMAPRKSLGGIDIIRPLLNVKRSEIIDFLKKNKKCYRLDPTNRKKYFFRNKIRLNLIPLLEKKYNPNIRETLSSLADITCLDYDFLWQNANRAFQKIARSRNKDRLSLDIKLIKQLHPSQRRMLTRLAIETLKGDTRRLTLQHLVEIEDLIFARPIKSVVFLPKGITAEKSRSHLTFKLCT